VSIEANVQVIRRFFSELDRANLDALDEIFTDDYTLHFTGAPGPLDRTGTRYMFGGFFASFPGLTHRIEDTVAEDDKVAVRLTIRGTQSGEFQGIPPTGKSFELTSLNIFHLAGGRIASQWAQFDAMGMLQQLGAMPAPGGAGD
jgi:steroid delta-isomerase-like uncharacterized protein